MKTDATKVDKKASINYRMKKTITLFFLFIFGIAFAKAQTVSDTVKNHCYTIDGTYQIQLINSRSQPLIPANLNKIILDNRDATEIKYVKLGTEVRIKILPLSEINKPDFQPLARIGYVSE